MSLELTTSTTLTDMIKLQLSGLSSLITADGYAFVCDQTVAELGWDFPVTDPTRAYWMIKRGTRHAIEILRIASANKFKYKQVNLQHRFEHFQKLIEEYDAEFLAAMAENAALFAGVSNYQLFGTVIAAGFRYDVDGFDLTYDDRNLVQFHPCDEDA